MGNIDYVLESGTEFTLKGPDADGRISGLG